MALRRKSLIKPRAVAFDRQNGRCFYCGQPMCQGDIQQFTQAHRISAKQAKWLQCTGEHLTPHKNGGGVSSSNIVAACYWCNSKRHARSTDLSPEKYRLMVAKLMAKGGWHPARISSSGCDGLEPMHKWATGLGH